MELRKGKIILAVQYPLSVSDRSRLTINEDLEDAYDLVYVNSRNDIFRMMSLPCWPGKGLVLYGRFVVKRMLHKWYYQIKKPMRFYNIDMDGYDQLVAYIPKRTTPSVCKPFMAVCEKASKRRLVRYKTYPKLAVIDGITSHGPILRFVDGKRYAVTMPETNPA